MQNDQITIADRALNESIIFLAKYQNSFWSYARGEGTAILLVSGTILFFIAGTASTADSHPYKPVWVYICFALVVFFGAWIITFFVCNFVNILVIVTFGVGVYVSRALAHYSYLMCVYGDRRISSRRRTRCGLCRRRSQLFCQRVRVTHPSPSTFCRPNPPTSPPTDNQPPLFCQLALTLH
ncbi:hypothetical protein BKA57DRAFT_166278 [Linnemannia elongata]|nr:hypothetical protein BKA57DRAFT_166278 [Linnemannia elongata]